MNKNKTLLLFVILPLILVTQVRAQNSYPTTGKALVSGLDIGPSRNVLSSNVGLNLGHTNLTNINITHDTWSGSHAILFNAYQAVGNLSGGLNVTGNTKFSNDLGAYNGGAGSIMYFGNGGTMAFYVSDASTGKDSDIDWGSAKMAIKRSGDIGIGNSSPSTKLEVYTGAISAASGIDLSQGSDSNNRLSGRLFFSNKGELNNSFSLVKSGDGFSIRSGATPGSSSGTERMTIVNDGKVGIGTTNPIAKLDIVGNTFADHTVSAVSIPLRLKNTFDSSSDKDSSVDFVLSRWELGGDNRPETRLDFRLAGNDNQTYDQDFPNVDVMSLRSDGRVGIGTTNPDQALTVKGKIHSEEIIVDLSVPGPDYVFEEDYDLPTLAEIEAFIKANKHLPEVPSAKEMEANGISLGEMNMLLLKKIEELTLINIAQQKEIDGLKEKEIGRVDQKEMNSNQLELIKELITRIEKLEVEK